MVTQLRQLCVKLNLNLTQVLLVERSIHMERVGVLQETVAIKEQANRRRRCNRTSKVQAEMRPEAKPFYLWQQVRSVTEGGQSCHHGGTGQ